MNITSDALKSLPWMKYYPHLWPRGQSSQWIPSHTTEGSLKLLSYHKEDRCLPPNPRLKASQQVSQSYAILHADHSRWFLDWCPLTLKTLLSCSHCAITDSFYVLFSKATIFSSVYIGPLFFSACIHQMHGSSPSTVEVRGYEDLAISALSRSHAMVWDALPLLH